MLEIFRPFVKAILASPKCLIRIFKEYLLHVGAAASIWRAPDGFETWFIKDGNPSPQELSKRLVRQSTRTLLTIPMVCIVIGGIVTVTGKFMGGTSLQEDYHVITVLIWAEALLIPFAVCSAAFAIGVTYVRRIAIDKLGLGPDSRVAARQYPWKFAEAATMYGILAAAAYPVAVLIVFTALAVLGGVLTYFGGEIHTDEFNLGNLPFAVILMVASPMQMLVFITLPMSYNTLFQPRWYFCVTHYIAWGLFLSVTVPLFSTVGFYLESSLPYVDSIVKPLFDRLIPF